MKLELGEINGKMIALLAVLVVGGLGYGWWQYLYQPAVAARVTAKQARDAAQQALAAEQKKLEDATNLSASSDSKSDDHEAIGRIQIAKTAIPRGDETLLPAIQQIERLVRKSGVKATISDVSKGTDNGAAAGSGSGTSTSASIDISGHASPGMLLGLIRAVNDTGRVYRGKIYVSDRLLAITKISITKGDAATSSTSTSSTTSTSTDTPTSETIPADHVSFTMTIVFYMEPVASDASAGAGGASATGAATDPAAAGATGAAGTSGAGGAGLVIVTVFPA